MITWKELQVRKTPVEPHRLLLQRSIPSQPRLCALPTQGQTDGFRKSWSRSSRQLLRFARDSSLASAITSCLPFRACRESEWLLMVQVDAVISGLHLRATQIYLQDFSPTDLDLVASWCCYLAEPNAQLLRQLNKQHQLVSDKCEISESSMAPRGSVV